RPRRCVAVHAGWAPHRRRRGGVRSPAFRSRSGPPQQLTSTRWRHSRIACDGREVQDAHMSHIPLLVDARWVQVHPDARIVDLRAWTEAGLPVTREEPRIAPAQLRRLTLNRSRLADVADVQARRSTVLDARAPERYRGEVEPIDRKAGHIPGALNAPFSANLTPAQRFRPPEELRQLYSRYGSDVIVSCGSGVTACHDALAIELAGLP